LFITTGLETGGAEGILSSLIQHVDRSKFSPMLINLGHEGPKLQEVLDSGCLYQSINFHRGFILFQLFAFLETVWSFKPNVIQGWMYQGSFFALLAKIIWPWSKCFLGIRNYEFNQTTVSKNTLFCIRSIKLLVFLSEKCIFPSKQAKVLHENAGFLKKKSEIIENGCDIERFYPISASEKNHLKEKWGLSQQKLVLGYVSRYHPHKDPETFLNVVSLLVQKIPDLQVLCVGQGLSPENKGLMGKIQQLGLENFILLKGVVPSISEIYPMFDLLMLTSVSEAFPNVVLEAMACEVLCVSTNVGNVKELMGSFFRGADPGDVANLVNQVEEILKNPGFEKSELRKWVKSHFELQIMVESYENCWSK
jgi:glycosyltransferase involved in cell wall biosynthesis